MFDREVAEISEKMKKEEGSIVKALAHMKELSSELYKNVSFFVESESAWYVNIRYET